MSSAAEATTALDHGVDEIVYEVESCLELCGSSTSGIGHNLTAAHGQQGLHSEVLSGWFLLDTIGKGRVDDIDPVVNRCYPTNVLCRFPNSTDICLLTLDTQMSTLLDEPIARPEPPLIS